MKAFVIIICFAFGLFQLILLFKIWAACNDIREIKNKIPSNYAQNNVDYNFNELTSIQTPSIKNNNVANPNTLIGKLFRINSSGILVKTKGYIKEEDSFSCIISTSEKEFVDSGVISKFKSNELINI